MKTKTQKEKSQFLKNRLKNIYKNIDRAKRKEPIKLLAVTKTISEEKVQEALKLGIKYFGENKVQEAEKKFSNKPENIELHLIGHLQKNKIKKALKIFDVIQTVDTLELAEKINHHAKSDNKIQRIYCQINIGEDPKKFGFNKLEALNEINKIKNLNNITVEGIMTILPLQLSIKENEELYKQTNNIYKKTKETCSKCVELSMGMSGDYETAINCGATIVRIGTALFGKR